MDETMKSTIKAAVGGLTELVLSLVGRAGAGGAGKKDGDAGEATEEGGAACHGND